MSRYGEVSKLGPEDDDDLLPKEKPIIWYCEDGKPPRQVDYTGITLATCSEGHIHEIILGDIDAVDAFIEAVVSDDYQHTATSRLGVAASPIEQLLDMVENRLREEVGIAYDNFIETLGDDPETAILKEHTDEMMRLSLLAKEGKGSKDAVFLHMARAMVDPAFLTAMRSRDGEALFLGHDTLFEAAIAGEEGVPGDFLVLGPTARLDLIEQALDEREANEATT